jgi:hypothetical protein
VQVDRTMAIASTSSAQAQRVCAVGREPLQTLGSTKDIFAALQCDVLPSFQEAVADLVKAIRCGILVVSNPPRREKVIAQIEIAASISLQTADDLAQKYSSETQLTVSQIAVLLLYSLQTDPDGPDSVHALTNSVLRDSDRSKMKAIRSFLFLFDNALYNCPKIENHIVYCCAAGDLRHQYVTAQIIIWHQATSCIDTLDAMNNANSLGTSAARTIFSIELAPKSRARGIPDFWPIPSDAEIILPPNTRFRVRDSLARLHSFSAHDP